MNIRRVWQQSTIEAFAEQHGLTLEMHRRASIGPMAYYCHFERCEVMDGGCLAGTYGNGSTEQDAIHNYAKAISGKRVAIGAYSPDRREIEVPFLT